MGRFRDLQVAQWAAIVVEGANQELLGRAAADDAIPPAIRRRMGKLERLAACCALGVLGGAPTGELIFCSRYGNVESLSVLLRGIAEEQLISPMLFSGSVHNATPGLIGQIRKERLGHTALAAGPNSFAAGLIESYARLASGECSDVTLIFADVPLPDPYGEFEVENAPGLALAMRLEPGAEGGLAVRPGRRGVRELLEKLKHGPVNLAVGAWAPA